MFPASGIWMNLEVLWSSFIHPWEWNPGNSMEFLGLQMSLVCASLPRDHRLHFGLWKIIQPPSAPGAVLKSRLSREASGSSGRKLRRRGKDGKRMEKAKMVNSREGYQMLPISSRPRGTLTQHMFAPWPSFPIWFMLIPWLVGRILIKFQKRRLSASEVIWLYLDQSVRFAAIQSTSKIQWKLDEDSRIVISCDTSPGFSACNWVVKTFSQPDRLVLLIPDHRWRSIERIWAM